MRPLNKTLTMGVLLFFTTHAFAQLDFSSPRYVRDSGEPLEMVLGDFDGNALTDFAYVAAGRRVFVFHQQPDHSFDSTSIFLGDGDPAIMSIASGDLNKDGLTDFVVFDNATTGDHVFVFLSTGTSFSRSDLPSSGGIISKDTEIADINNDGHADIIVATDAGPFLFFQGSGTGTFESKQIPSTSGIHKFLIRDLNADNLNDMAGLNFDNQLVILKASSGGEFTESEITFTDFPSDLLVDDFSDDQIPDIVVSFGSPKPVLTSLVNNGDASFTSSELSGFPQVYNRLLSIDYDGDGFTDILGSGDIAHPVVVLHNNGDNTFTHVPLETNSQFVFDLKGGDIDGNDTIEIVARTGVKKIEIYRFDTDFSLQQSILLGISPQRAKIADMDKDGFKDFIVSNTLANAITVLYGDAESTYSRRKNFMLKNEVGPIAIADFNEDDYPDIAYSTGTATVWRATGIFYSNADGILADTSGVFYTNSIYHLDAADVNNDGHVDLIGDNILFKADEQGYFHETAFANGINSYVSLVGDLNNDTFVDVVLNSNLTLYILMNDGEGNFPTTVSFPTTRTNATIELADANGDTYPDIIGSHYDNTLTFFINDQSGNFEAEEISVSGSTVLSSTLTDFNKDGKKDLIGNNPTSVAIFLQNEAGGFEHFKNIELSQNTTPGIHLTDYLNEDDAIDLIMFSTSGHPVTIVENDLVEEPELPTVAITITHITSHSAQITLAPGDGNGRLVIIGENELSVSPEDNAFYTANASYGEGHEIEEGRYVVISSDDLSFTVENLDTTTTYHVSAFEFDANEAATFINYHPTATSISFETKDVQVINVPDDVTFTDANATLAITVTASSGLPVTLEKVSENISIAGDQITITIPGPVEVIATQAGNNEFDSASDTLTFCANPAVPTISIGINDPYEVVLTSSSDINNQWLANGTEVAGETDTVYKPEVNGVFTVKVSYDGCFSVSEPTDLLVTSTDESGKSSVAVFPNPVKDRLSISSHDIIKYVHITDGLGRSLVQVNVNEREAFIDFTQMPAGIYILSLETQSGLLKKKISRK